MATSELLALTPAGLYCRAGDFYVDPWRPVDRAVITHAHGDHATRGHGRYLAAAPGEAVLRARMGDITLDAVPYAEPVHINGVRVSLHPAGHVLGSAQVRVEHAGEVWAVSGDYKTECDPTCAPIEPVRCHTFITESTFGLPIYRWRPERELFSELMQWWRSNQAAGRASVIYAYAFGKAQRVLSGVDASIGPLVCHGAVEALNRAYRAAGVSLPATVLAHDLPRDFDFSRALIVAPPSAQGTPWLRRFGEHADAFASGWMQIRGVRRRRALDRGFALSDHADWPGLNDVIQATGAQRVLVTHGYAGTMVRWLQSRGLDAATLATPYTGETGEQDVDLPAEAATAAVQ